jgi:hypothetical protein
MLKNTDCGTAFICTMVSNAWIFRVVAEDRLFAAARAVYEATINSFV